MVEVAGFPVFSSISFIEGPGGKKNRQKERRLMKGFLSVSGSSATGNSVSPGSGRLSVNHCSRIETTEVKLDMGNCRKLSTVGVGLNKITEFVVGGGDKKLLAVPGNGPVTLVVSSPESGEAVARTRRAGGGREKKTEPE